MNADYVCTHARGNQHSPGKCGLPAKWNGRTFRCAFHSAPEQVNRRARKAAK